MKYSSPIVFYWAEITGYVCGVLEEVSKLVDGNIVVVHWDKRNINSTKFIIDESSKIQFLNRSQHDKEQLLEILSTIRPGIIVVSGWMDSGYIWACKKYKANNSEVKVVAASDSQWTGSIRQRIGQIYHRLFLRNVLDFMWIPGQPQFAFAQRYGYEIETILSNLYSADSRVFTTRAKINRRFIFVGRFVTVKAIDLLLDAYLSLPSNIQKEWPLLLIGDGDQRDMVMERRNENVEVLPFLQPEVLREELLKGGVGCLTTHKDQWGVVIHEYALLGFPMLISSGCGAATEFLIPGYNGFIFIKGNFDSLRQAMIRFTQLSDEELAAFGANSSELGAKISSKLSANSLLSVRYY